ncbi:MAG: DUF4367 domain-containing protein [Clostridia bacterium]|nr:DUF4367 domain-containing protein [Clostridia bacterium]
MAKKTNNKNAVRDSLIRNGAKKWLRGEIDAFRTIDTEGIAISAETDEAIRAAIRQERRRGWLDGLWRISRSTAGFLVTAVAILFALTMTVQPVRAAFWDAVVNYYASAVKVRLPAEETVPARIEEVRYPTYLPAGWRLGGVDAGEREVHYELTDDGDAYVFVLQSAASEANETRFDPAELGVEQVERGGRDVLILTHPDGKVSVTWTDEYNFLLTGIRTDASVLLKIAESMMK